MPRTRKPPPFETVGDIVAKIGEVAIERIRVHPKPGTATEKDLLRLLTHTDRLYELVDGVLVEKVMGFAESLLAAELIRLVGNIVVERDLGVVVGADGAMRLMPGLIRIPDVSFISWKQLPDKMVPREPIPGLAPDLAIEVLSESNTRSEMERKLKDYFLSGVQLVWYIDPQKRTATVYTAPDQSRLVDEEGTLDGGDVLPGLAIPLKSLFVRIPAAQPKGKTKRSSQNKLR